MTDVGAAPEPTAPVCRAITIGVSGRPGGPSELPFTTELVPQVADALRSVGYETKIVNAAELTSTELATAVHAELGASADDLLIVHVIAHGRRGEGGGTVYATGSDETVEPAADINNWLNAVQNRVGPRTLFLLDLCWSGTLTRLPWQSWIDTEKARGWVIAACMPDQVAYDGLFTEAVVTVLRAVHAGELDIHPALEHVPLAAVARAIHQEVNRLSMARDTSPQRVTASLIDMSVDPRLPFFRNKNHAPGPMAEARANLDPQLLAFLDETLDAHHFIERATGAGRFAEQTGELVGCFSGRDEQLKDLRPWVNAYGPGTLRVVTGSPGVGKSALLGLIVCAAHRDLHELTRKVWEQVSAPHVLLDLAAVHARRRAVDVVVRSLATQLGLSSESGVDGLIADLTTRAGQPVVVVDALDEADDPAAIMNDLLLPLAKARRPDHRPLVRLLVGVRNGPEYSQYEPLFELAEREGRLVDLDKVAPHELENDLYDYILKLLRSNPVYRNQGAVQGEFANQVAGVLSAPDTSRERWGPFLVAALYTQHLISTYPEPGMITSDEARLLGEKTPRDLPAVLELDLTGPAGHRWVRPVMAALACAKGQGMPISVLVRTAAVFAEDGAAPGTAEIRDALGAATFYVRQAMDTDRTTVYRLFHQSLVDYLDAHPRGSDDRRAARADGPQGSDASAVVDALLRPLGPPVARSWAAAEPYLFRHVLDHADRAGRLEELLTDPGFLFARQSFGPLSELDPDLHPVLALLPQMRDLTTSREDSTRLALSLIRLGFDQLAERVAETASGGPLSWRPKWTIGNQAWVLVNATKSVDTIRPSEGHVRALVISSDGGTAAFCGHDGELNVYDVERGSFRSFALVGSSYDRCVLAIAADGQMFAFGNDRGVVRVLDLRPGSGLNAFHGRLGHPVVAIALDAATSRGVAVDETGGMLRWQNGQGEPTSMVGLPGNKVWSAAVVDDTVTVAYGTENGELRRSHMPSHDTVTTIRDHIGAVTGIALSGGTGMAVASISNARVQVSLGAWWRLSTSAKLTAVAISATGRYVAVGDDAGSVFVWDVRCDELLGSSKLHETAVVHLSISDGPVRTVSSDTGGIIQLWHPSSSMDRTRTIVGRAAAVTAVAVHQGTGNSLAVVADEAGYTRVLDLTTLRSRELGRDETCPALFVSTQVVADRVIVHTYHEDHARAWDLASGTRTGSRWAGLFTRQQAEATRATIFLSDRLVSLSGEQDGTVQICEITDEDVPTTAPLPAHDRAVTAVTCFVSHGVPTAYTADDGGLIRIWDLSDWRPGDGRWRLVDEIIVSAPVFELVATQDGWLVVRAGGEAIGFRHTSTEAR